MRRIPDDHYLLSGAKQSLTEELADEVQTVDVIAYGFSHYVNQHEKNPEKQNVTEINFITRDGEVYSASSHGIIASFQRIIEDNDNVPALKFRIKQVKIKNGEFAGRDSWMIAPVVPENFLQELDDLPF